MTHTLDIPPPPFVGHRDPLDGPKYVMLSENNSVAGGPQHPPLRPPPYRRSLHAYLSQRRSTKTGNCCRSCLCCFCCFLLVFIVLVAALLLYLRFTFDPQVPSYKVEHFDVEAFNIQPSNSIVSMKFAITVRAVNPNKKIGIRYGEGSSVLIGYKGARLGSGRLPIFYQRPRNTTKMVVAIKGRSKVGAARQSALFGNQQAGDVPLHVSVKAPLGLAVGQTELVKVKVHIDCTLVVDSLAPGKKVTIKSTDYNVDVKL